MDHKNIKLMTGKIVEEITETDLDEKIADLQAAITRYQGHIDNYQADLVVLQGVKDSI